MADTSTLRLRIFDGSRQFFSKAADFLVKIVDGNQTQHVWRDYTQSDITFNGLPSITTSSTTTPSSSPPKATSRRATSR
jgi:hypothetical protein